MLFGNNNCQYLLPGEIEYKRIPELIPGLSNIKQISSGMYHYLALSEDGSVYAFGKKK